MRVEITFPSYDANHRAFVTWRPQEVKLKLVDVPAGNANVPVAVSSKSMAAGGRLVFATRLTHQGTASLNLTLPANGTPASVWVGGEFPAASSRHGDVSVEVRTAAGSTLLGTHPTMVRVRKNADMISNPERDRFLDALATLNGAGSGRYRDFRDMHVAGAPDREAHGGAGFLPWHRAYLLDFERELQAINGEVTLPYWRFDQSAPKLFSRNFIGLPSAAGQVQFTPGHPLLSWVAGGLPGIERGTGVGPSTVPALRTEAQTLALGGSTSPAFANFRNMQGNPHGRAHTSHGAGWITIPSTAPRDPLFFLLHCNVDRLWAKWQWGTKLHDPAAPRAFDPSPTSAPGHRLNDRLWPWSGPLAAPRPTTAPGGELAASPMTTVPGASPRVRDMIDYFGIVSPADQAFAYDDVPFQN